MSKNDKKRYNSDLNHAVILQIICTAIKSSVTDKINKKFIFDF